MKWGFRQFFPIFSFRQSYQKEDIDFWQETAELDDTVSILPLKTMRFPQTPSMNKAWENVGRHLYKAEGKQEKIISRRGGR